MNNAGTTDQVFALTMSVAEHEVRSNELLAELEALCARAADAFTASRKRNIESIPPTARRILIVDSDDPTVRRAERTLTTLDCEPEIDVATSAAIARAKLAEQAYHVVVVNLTLVNGSAGDVIRAARAVRPLTWVVLTGRLSPHDGERMARTLDANDWLVEGHSASDLKYVVGKGLGQFERPAEPAQRERRPHRPLKFEKRGRD